MIAYRYDAANNTYEDEPVPVARLRADLARNSTLIVIESRAPAPGDGVAVRADIMQAIAVAREMACVSP